jgi:hypothetical protein
MCDKSCRKHAPFLYNLKDKLIDDGVKILMSQNAKEVNVRDGEQEEEIQMKEIVLEYKSNNKQ